MIAFILLMGSMPIQAHSDNIKKPTIEWIGFVDARQPESILVVGSDTTLGKNKHLPFFRLSDPMAPKIECCLSMQSLSVSSSVLRYLDDDKTKNTITEQGLRAQLRSKTKTGFVGLAFPPESRIQMKRLNPRELVLQRSTRSGHLAPLYVRHCLSQEGLHVWLRYSNRTLSPSIHYHLPLAADVQANCPAPWVASM